MTQEVMELKLRQPQPWGRTTSLPVATLLPLVADEAAEPSAGFIEGLRVVGLVLEPVILTRTPGGRLSVKDGIRRIKGAAAAGLEQVPVRIFESMSGDTAAAVTLITNYHRSPNAVAELRAMEKLMEAGRSAEDIAAGLALPLGRVQRRLRLQKLVPALRAAFDGGRIPVSVAEQAARLPRRAQQNLAKEMELRAGAGESASLTAGAVRAERQATTAAVAGSLPDALFPAAEAPPVMVNHDPEFNVKAWEAKKVLESLGWTWSNNTWRKP